MGNASGIPICSEAWLIGVGKEEVGCHNDVAHEARWLAWAQRTKSTTDTDDYEFLHGVGVQEIRGIEKLRFGTGASDLTTPKDHGIVTGFFAAAND